MASYEEMLMNQSDANSAFNAAQAEINRDWQEYMSGTAHQREKWDLIRAGLNPVLSANSGASWNTVANASADPSSASGMAMLAATILNNATALQQSLVSAEATKAAAGASAAAQIQASQNSANAVMEAAKVANEGTHYTANQSYESAKINAGAKLSSDPIGLIGSFLNNFAGGNLFQQATGFAKAMADNYIGNW